MKSKGNFPKCQLPFLRNGLHLPYRPTSRALFRPCLAKAAVTWSAFVTSIKQCYSKNLFFFQKGPKIWLFLYIFGANWLGIFVVYSISTLHFHSSRSCEHLWTRFSTLEHQRSWFQTCPQTQTKLTWVHWASFFQLYQSLKYLKKCWKISCEFDSFCFCWLIPVVGLLFLFFFKLFLLRCNNSESFNALLTI